MNDKVYEKSLELNVGAELLSHLRCHMQMRKAYLRGLTQREEKSAGVDFFTRLPGDTRFFAFQFKAPIGRNDDLPYKFTLNRDQHSSLHNLSLQHPRAVFYVFPFYASVQKLEQHVPILARDTWLLPAYRFRASEIFAGQQSKRVRCWRGIVRVNPESEMERLSNFELSIEDGIGHEQFLHWYMNLPHRRNTLTDSPIRISPHFVRGLRLAIITGNRPSGILEV